MIPGGYWPPSSKVEIANFGGGTNCSSWSFIGFIFLEYLRGTKTFFFAFAQENSPVQPLLLWMPEAVWGGYHHLDNDIIMPSLATPQMNPPQSEPSTVGISITARGCLRVCPLPAYQCAQTLCISLSGRQDFDIATIRVSEISVYYENRVRVPT